MSRQPCPNEFEGCPDPFADDHHIYKECEADTPLKRVYANLGCNVMNVCRCLHREIEAEGLWLPYPSDGVMIDTINQEMQQGNASLSSTRKKKIGL